MDLFVENDFAPLIFSVGRIVSGSVIARQISRLRLLSFGAFVLFSHVCATTAVVSSSQPGEEQHMADPTPSKVDRRFAMLGP